MNALEPSVIKDMNDPDPARRYKAVCLFDTRVRPVPFQYRTMVSPDGLHWKLFGSEPISPGADVITGYFDERLKLYVAFPKIGTQVRGHRRRVFYLITSEDFQHWSQPRLVWTPDLRDDAGSLGRIEQVRPLLDVPDDPAFMRTEFYGISVYVAESCTLGFPWVFTINNNQRTGINQEGPIEVQLASSRDLVSWERHFRAPAISLGAIGEWDCGMIITQFRALRVGDEIWFYYGGCNYTHGLPDFRLAEETGRGRRYTTNVGLAKWKLDRFVSVDGPAEGGTLTTIPIVFDGKRL